MIGVPQHPFKEQPGLIQLFGKSQTRTRQRLYEPKRTQIEGAFLSREPVNAGLRRIAIYQAVADEAAMAGIFEDGADGAEHPRIVRAMKKTNARRVTAPGILEQVLLSLRIEDVVTTQDRRRLLSEARAVPPLIFGTMVNSSTVMPESST